MAKKNQIKKTTAARKPYCFVSYSTREPQVQLLIDCLRIVFGPHFEVQLTPSALTSGASQLAQITELITGCSFAVVILDGFRPNVIFEYGILHGMKKPVILLKETDAKVDINTYYPNTPELALNPVLINLDTHLSDVKDVNYASWNRFEIQQTVNLVCDEYNKKMQSLEGYIPVKAPKLW